MDNENFMKDKIFFGREIAFVLSGKKISSNEIDEIDDFPGKEDFIRFYTAHNGGYFMDRACFFPEDCYKVSVCGNPYISVDCFLEIPVDDMDDDGINIERLKDLIEFDWEGYEDFMLFHIPFALDIVQNPFWIDIQTGEIKYTDLEECPNPDEDAITVASSFKDFCKRIK